MKARCFANCTGDPKIDPEDGKPLDKPLHYGFKRGLIYHIEPDASWAIWFNDLETGKRIKEPPVHKAKGLTTPHKKQRRKRQQKPKPQVEAQL